jgi:hypothetical protein
VIQFSRLVETGLRVHPKVSKNPVLGAGELPTSIQVGFPARTTNLQKRDAPLRYLNEF